MDYSELKAKYSVKEIKNFDPYGLEFAKENITPNYYRYLVVIYGFIYLIFLALSLLLTFATIRLLIVRGVDYVGDNIMLASVGPFFLLMALLLFIAYKYERNKKLINIYSFYKFAVKNKLKYIYKSLLQDIMDRGDIYLPKNGLIYGSGRKKKYSDLVGDLKFSLGNYYFVTGYGRSTKEHSWVVGATKLSRNLPHIVLDAKSNNNLGITNLPKSFKSNQITNAEPALIDHFNLYAPPGYKIDSLSFIAPDFIDVLIKNCKDFDIEIIDDTLYLYQMGYIEKDNYEGLITKMQIIVKSLEDNIDTYIDTKAVHTSNIKGLDSISPEGRRLLVDNRVKIITTIAISIYIFLVLIDIARSFIKFW